MKWINRNDSETNYEDRRGRGVKRGITMGGGGILVVLVLSLLLGKNPMQMLELVGGLTEQSVETVDESQAKENEDLKDFTLGVFNSANDVWSEIFRNRLEKNYKAPVLVTFTGQTQSGCGAASSSSGPFYCPADEKVYIDLAFFYELANRFKAPGDLAMAYVTAHEVGHHIQKQLGILDQVQQLRSRLSEAQYNKMNVKLELQADFFAGLWAYHAQKMNIIELEQGDLESAIKAAQAIGDDTLQKEAQGYAVPDSFTHGTSAQRMYWFNKGFQTGDYSQGDTFNDPSLN
ncbi:MAG: neutral zinc metallopeptidase [Dysgonamonadaceae bacterium]|jgi:predicted metalloprotease|nr:neutral zinc metallopeptidase [Dysgonamonadaceae bacterium]